MVVRQSIVETRQILEADATRDAGDRRRLLGEHVQVREAPVARLEQPRVYPERIGRGGGALRDPHREHERQSGPRLPALAEIVDVGIIGRARLFGAARAHAIREQQRRIADHQSRVVRLVQKARDVRELGIAGRVLGLRAPHVLEQEPRERDARHRAARHEHAASRELVPPARGRRASRCAPGRRR